MVVSAADPGSLPRLVEVLRDGGVAIAPCDTMYGLVGIAPDTERRIRGIKGRGEEKPFLQLLPDRSWVAHYSDLAVPPRLSKYWPGPLTLVFPLRRGGTVAFRVPDSTFLRNLLGAIGRPLFSTSANRTGTPPLDRIVDIREEFEDVIDLIFDAGDLPAGLPSTIVDVCSRPYRVLRAGALVVRPEDLA